MSQEVISTQVLHLQVMGDEGHGPSKGTSD